MAHQGQWTSLSDIHRLGYIAQDCWNSSLFTYIGQFTYSIEVELKCAQALVCAKYMARHCRTSVLN